MRMWTLGDWDEGEKRVVVSVACLEKLQALSAGGSGGDVQFELDLQELVTGSWVGGRQRSTGEPMHGHIDMCDDLRCCCHAASNRLVVRPLVDNVVPWIGSVRKHRWVVTSAEKWEELKAAALSRFPACARTGRAALELGPERLAAEEPCWSCREADTQTFVENTLFKVVIHDDVIGVRDYTTVELTSGMPLMEAVLSINSALRANKAFAAVKANRGFGNVKVWRRRCGQSEDCQLTYLTTLCTNGVRHAWHDADSTLSSCGITTECVFVVSNIMATTGTGTFKSPRGVDRAVAANPLQAQWAKAIPQGARLWCEAQLKVLNTFIYMEVQASPELPADPRVCQSLVEFVLAEWNEHHNSPEQLVHSAGEIYNRWSQHQIAQTSAEVASRKQFMEQVKALEEKSQALKVPAEYCCHKTGQLLHNPVSLVAPQRYPAGMVFIKVKDAGGAYVDPRTLLYERGLPGQFTLHVCPYCDAGPFHSRQALTGHWSSCGGLRGEVAPQGTTQFVGLCQDTGMFQVSSNTEHAKDIMGKAQVTHTRPTTCTMLTPGLTALMKIHSSRSRCPHSPCVSSCRPSVRAMLSSCLAFAKRQWRSWWKWRSWWSNR